MITAIILSILALILGIIIRLSDEAPILDMAIIIIGSFLMFYTLFIFDTPTAMDVYQGKTTLEITYKDGVAVDSVVVFKDKEK